jgi:hypothetical protein
VQLWSGGCFLKRKEDPSSARVNYWELVEPQGKDILAGGQVLREGDYDSVSSPEQRKLVPFSFGGWDGKRRRNPLQRILALIVSH